MCVANLRSFVCLFPFRRSQGVRAVNGTSFDYRASRLVRRVAAANRRGACVPHALRCRHDYLCGVLEAFLRYGASRRNGRLFFQILVECGVLCLLQGEEGYVIRD